MLCVFAFAFAMHAFFPFLSFQIWECLHIFAEERKNKCITFSRSKSNKQIVRMRIGFTFYAHWANNEISHCGISMCDEKKKNKYRWRDYE